MMQLKADYVTLIIDKTNSCGLGWMYNGMADYAYTGNPSFQAWLCHN